MTVVRRQFLKAAVAALAATGTTACFGSFPAIRWVYGFNKGISGNKFIQWLLFLVLTIIPVYGIAALVDIWILNSIEFWFGGAPDLPEASKEKGERVVQLDDGTTLRMVKDKERGRFELHHDDGKEVRSFCFDMNDDVARVVDAQGREIARAREDRDNAVEVYSGGRLVERYDADVVKDAVRSYEEGGAPATAAFAARLGSSTGGVARR